jgi:hypothetical protein
VDSIRDCLSDSLPGDVHANVKAGEVKAFSEQGYKVWRARVTGVTAEQAGDAHDGKVEKETTEAVSRVSLSELQQQIDNYTRNIQDYQKTLDKLLALKETLLGAKTAKE